MNNGNILSARQLMILIILFSVGTTILVVPSMLAAETKQDAWISGVVGVSIGLLFLMMYVRLVHMYPDYTLFDMNERLLGKWLGKAVTLLLIFTAVVISAQVLYYIGTFMTTQIMPTTPMHAINILMITFVIMGSKLGIIILGRTAEIFFPWILLLFFLLVIFVTPQAHFKNLLPIGEASILSITRASIFMIVYSYFPIIFTLCLISSDAKFPNRLAKSFLYGGISSGIMMISIAFLSIMVMGPDQSSRQIYATYALAKKISVGNFLQRIEVTVAFLWFISIYFKLTLYFHVAIKGLASLFQIQNYKSLSTPVGLIVTVLSLVVYPNSAYTHQWDILTWVPLTVCFGFIYPVLLIGLSYLRGKRDKKG
ncbi:endospore germination permease [Paenibacillus alginolyticus]|uniref:Endospore germination permease n=1 Tax=Paenibacillus alginolyticus TaxID=59839 RepID=A0ABT4GNQ7_9BACL|nr:endospore germination permease [Paenibacillus alginolyticus]MCY9669649.1 endospore germination permease [Paenibacillus alginolyticus]MCY9697838.1 endospore germination permease [Paenibacillus alginolyticus]MEC0141896.1 endospore germination permease [Paenibacillus alginolyticus]